MWVLLLVSVAGFFAQLIDGSMGMAFGVSATSFLLLLSYSPATASAVVHIAEVATTAVSGLSHMKFGNVDWPTLVRIALPGSLGAFGGAMLLSSIDLSAARPWTAGVLLVLGVVIIIKFAKVRATRSLRSPQKRWLVPLGLTGGFVDATGGGGWGPVVTTSLTVSRVLEPRKAIGTTNTAEFAVAISASVGFLIGLGSQGIPWSAVVALIIGGVFAAPVAAWVIAHAQQRMLGLAVGFLIVALNLRQLGLAFDLPSSLLWTLVAAVAGTGAAILIGLFARSRSAKKRA
jgi:uncharacterized membrane protein YfcA